ncbi:hypothetical protein B4Q13_23585, partial [Lacticaseibacillus rhamnosus]
KAKYDKLSRSSRSGVSCRQRSERQHDFAAMEASIDLLRRGLRTSDILPQPNGYSEITSLRRA